MIVLGLCSSALAQSGAPFSEAMLAASVRFDSDRTSEAALAQARARIARGDVVQAVPVLQEVLDHGEAVLVFHDGSYRNAADEANRLLARLPPAERELYERHAEGAARAHLDRAHATRDRVLWEAVARRYRYTDVGRQAARELAEQSFDVGDFRAAAAGYAALVEASATSEWDGQIAADIVVPWCAALLALGHVGRAESVRDDFTRQSRDSPHDATPRALEQVFAAAAKTGRSPSLSATAPPALAIVDVMPSGQSQVWRFATAHGNARNGDVLQQLREAGVARFYYGTPLILPGGGIVVRSAESLACLDAATGEKRWDHSWGPSGPPRAGRHGPTNAEIARATGDALHATLGFDGERVYAVRRPTAADLAEQRQQLAAAKAPEAAWNVLMAFNAANGHVVWQLNGAFAAQADGSEPQQYTTSPAWLFRGPPVPGPTGLLVLAERDKSLELCEFDGTSGRLRRFLPLCKLEGTTVYDERRAAQECTIIVDGDRAYCPTGAGAIVCVDLSRHAVRWATRYPRPTPPVSRDDAPTLGREPQVLWADGWRNTSLIAADDVLVLAPGEGDRLLVLDKETGAIRWTQSRGDGNYLAAVAEDRVIVVGRNDARGLHLADGGELWRSRTGETAGRGFATTTHYVLPLASGDVGAVALAHGAWTATFSFTPEVIPADRVHVPQPSPPATLLWADDGIARQSTAGIERLRNLHAARVAASAARDADPSSEPALARWAQAQLEAGDFAQAVETFRNRFEHAEDAGRENARRELFSAAMMLATHDPGQAPLAWSLASELAATDLERMQVVWQEWQLVTPDDPVALTARLVALLDLAPEDYFVVAADDDRVTRLDRVVLGRWKTLREEAGASAADLDARLREVFDSRSFGRDDERAALRFTMLLDSSTPSSTAPEAATSGDPPGERVAEWPLRKPRISSRPFPEGDIYFVSLPLLDLHPGRRDGLNVAVDRLGENVRFSGAGRDRPWGLPLPKSNDALRTPLELRHAWRIDDLVLLQVGADVFGIAPFDERGDPRASLRWPRPGETVRTTDLARAAADRPAARANTESLPVAEFDPGPHWQDEYGNRTGQVGPVRTRFFCVQRGSMLVAHDTADGRELWRRGNLSPGVRCHGDDDHIVIYDARRGTTTVLRALDGSSVGNSPAPFAPRELLTVYGSNALVALSDSRPRAENDVGEQLQLVDLATGSTLWTRDMPKGGICFPIDVRWCGVLEPAGLLHVLNLSDGATVVRHEVRVPQPLLQARSLKDARRVFVTLSGPRNDPGLEVATRGGGIHSNENPGRVIVNGNWLALDSDTGALLWQSQLDNVSLPLTQAQDTPLIVCSEVRSPQNPLGSGALEGRVRCFDRRTGELLFDEPTSGAHNYFIVERSREEEWVELRLRGRIVRFDYSAGDEP